MVPSLPVSVSVSVPGLEVAESPLESVSSLDDPVLVSPTDEVEALVVAVVPPSLPVPCVLVVPPASPVQAVNNNNAASVR